MRDGARKVMWEVLFGLSAVLIGLAGLGFLTASAYLALSEIVGAVWAAFCVGLVLVALAGGFVALAQRRPSRPAAVADPKPASGGDNPDAADLGSMIAFTVAFVLARSLSDKDRG